MSEQDIDSLEQKKCARNAQESELAHFSKTDVRYWKPRVRLPGASKNYCVEIQVRGDRRHWSLDTPNRGAAAARARDIYLAAKSNGWEKTEQAYRPALAAPTKRKAPTIGEFLAESGAKSGLSPKTFEDYARALRKIVTDVFDLDKGTSRYGYKGEAYKRRLDSILNVRLNRLTPAKVQEWKVNFLRRAGHDQIALRRAKISANSFLRRARSLFADSATRHLEIELPSPLPFEGVEFEEGQSLKYQSQIKPGELYQAAEKELATTHPEAFKIFLLAVMTGLRRREIDLLEWPSFDWEDDVIRVVPTKYFHPKTQESIRDVQAGARVMELFRGFRAKATGQFVVEANAQPRPGVTYEHYRCKEHFETLNDWLRDHGLQNVDKPLHTLRKEFGSQIVRRYGIFAGSKALGHESIGITNDFYADTASTVRLDIDDLMDQKPEQATNIIELKNAATAG